jgi:hypothetical protein
VSDKTPRVHTLATVVSCSGNNRTKRGQVVLHFGAPDARGRYDTCTLDLEQFRALGFAGLGHHADALRLTIEPLSAECHRDDA